MTARAVGWWERLVCALIGHDRCLLMEARWCARCGRVL